MFSVARCDVNLHTDILDTPDIFWDEAAKPRFGLSENLEKRGDPPKKMMVKRHFPLYNAHTWGIPYFQTKPFKQMLQPWLEYVGSWQRGATLGFSGKVWKDLCGLPNLFGYRDLDFDLDLRLHGRNQTTSVRCTIPVSLSSWLVRCHFDMMVLLANLGQACGSSDASFKASRINPTYRHCILGAQCAVTIKIMISCLQLAPPHFRLSGI